MKTNLTITDTKTKKSITFNKVDLELVGPYTFNLSKNVLKKIAVVLKNLNINWTSVVWTSSEHPNIKTFKKFSSGDPMFGYYIIEAEDLLNINNFVNIPFFKSLTLDYTLS